MPPPKRSSDLAPHGAFGIWATTTTITTCPRRSRRAASQVLKERADHDSPSETASTRRHQLLDQTRRRHRQDRPGRTRTVVLLAHDPRRLDEAAGLKIPWCSPVTPTAARWCCPVVGAGRGQKIPGRGRHRPTGRDDDLREPRRRNGLRAGSRELPAGGRGAHAAARLPEPPRTAG